MKRVEGFQYLKRESLDVRSSDTLYPLSNQSAPSEGDDGNKRMLHNGLPHRGTNTIHHVHHTRG